ncbi:STAS/SEC14 domain-containing protein [Alcanivorax sp. NBRC 102028]|nr:STAS/SEC14 domain-containing protein [Alcanivorax sp. NBRC 102028]
MQCAHDSQRSETPCRTSCRYVSAGLREGKGIITFSGKTKVHHEAQDIRNLAIQHTSRLNPGDTAGVSAHGELTAEDYRKVLAPAIEGALSQHDKINLLYEIGPTFDSFSAGAMLQDALVGLRHPLSWHRIAVVTSHDWISNVAQQASALIPGEVKAFK